MSRRLTVAVVAITSTLGCVSPEEGTSPVEPIPYEILEFVEIERSPEGEVNSTPLQGALEIYVNGVLDLHVVFQLRTRSPVEVMSYRLTFDELEDASEQPTQSKGTVEWDSETGLAFMEAARTLPPSADPSLWCALPRSVVDVTVAIGPYLAADGGPELVTSRTETLLLTMSDAGYEEVTTSPICTQR